MAAAPATPTSPWVKLALTAILVAAAAWATFPIEEKITLGLDLQGGTHLVLEVDLDDAVRSNGERMLVGLRGQLAADGIDTASAVQEEAGRIVVSGIPEDRRPAAEEAIRTWAAGWDASWSGDRATLAISQTAARDLRQAAARQVRETIDRRINEFGVREPLITQAGELGERIILQLPGLSDVERVRNIITRASVMDFRLGHGTGATREQLLASLGGTVPDGVELIQGAPDAHVSVAGQWFAVDRAPVASGEDLIDARTTLNEFGRPAIGFDFSADAGRRFGEFTGSHIGQPLAVVLDGQVVQYATIQAQIFTRGVITGNFSMAEADDAALTLRSGALPAGVTIEFEQNVGPALGHDSIAAGLRAGMVGTLIVVLFVLAWYKGAGVNAVIALAVNILFVMAALHALDATLTLPGIAGLVLTVGMTVDANVIIFERIKEELARGRSPAAAVDAGFDRATWTIVDSNVTTLIAAVFLYNFGTGPIKGFAVTLTLGLLAQMFTAIWLSRWLFDVVLSWRGGRGGLSIQWFPFWAPRVPFMRLRHVFVGISVVAVLASIAAWLVKGPTYGIDFEGGTQVVVGAPPGQSAEDLRARLAGTEFDGVTIQSFGSADQHQFLLRVHGAEKAVAETALNVGEAPDATTSAATRLMAILAPAATGIDLNSVGESELADALARDAGVSRDAADVAAAAIVAHRSASGGRIAGLDGLAAIPGVPAAAADWLAANARLTEYVVLKSESVGPAVGAELKSQAVRAVIWSLLGILAYVTIRFQFRFALAAILAVAHDVVVTVGVFVLLGREIDTTVIAALLTLVGFSLNDTVVIFDRIRENLGAMKGSTLSEILDASVNQTLSRTVLTSLTVFVGSLALLLLGGPVLAGFSLAMAIGVVAGSYSTIFVAGPIILAWERARQRRTHAREAIA